MIDRDRWTDAVKLGWRFHENCPANETAFNVQVAAAVQEYGAGRVEVGVAFGHTAPGLASDCDGFAIYVRDGEEIIGELQEDLLNYQHGHTMLVDPDQPTGAFDAIVDV